MGTGQCGARQGPLCGCHHPRLIKGSGCSSCCFQTHSPTLTLTLAARLLHGSGSLVAPGPRGLAEPGAGWQDAVSDDILLVADSDPFPQPQCGVCHTSPSPSQGEVCCPAVWGDLLLEGHRPGNMAELSVHREGISPSLHVLPQCLPKDSRGFTQRSVSSSSISGAGSEINNKNDAQLLYRALHLQSPLLA